MTERPVVGEEALQRMARMGLGKSSSQSEEDPIEQALETKRKMMAGDILSIELAKSQAEKAEAEAKAEKAKAETAKAQAEANRIASGEAEPGKSGFKVTGGIDMGHLDLGQERKEAADELKRLKEEADEGARATGQENQALRDKINDQNIKFLTLTFEAQMAQLTKMIEASSSKGNFVQQYTEAQETAKALGFAQPSPGSSDLQTTLAVKKLEFDQAVALRTMARDDKRSDREFQRQLNKDAEDREARKLDQGRQEKRDEMFTKAPQYIGSAIAQGLMANKGKGEGVTEEATPETKGSKGKLGYHIEAGWGESDEVECPGCRQPMAIGPTARVALCANCGERLSIGRTGEKPGAEEEE